MIIKSDGINYPSYFTEEFFAESLEHGLDEPRISIQDVQIEFGITPGENSCSQIYRVRVTFKRKKSDKIFYISLIVKSSLGGDVMDFLEHMDSFSKERTMYVKILPIMEVFLNGTKLAPKCFFTQKNPTGAFVFEDLGVLGYKLSNREIGLDLPHSEIAMRKMAQFHASSFGLAKKSSGIFEKFNEGILGKDAVLKSATLAGIFKGHLKMLVTISRKWEGFENIAKKLEKIHEENHKEHLVKCGSQRPGELAVLNHGDFWVNNIMFKYDEADDPVDCVFVDMQMNIYSSPGIDLNYFFNTSLSLDTMINRREHLVEVYYKSFKETLESLHLEEVPSFEKIIQEIAAREDFGFFASYGIFPTVTMDKSESQDLSCDSLMDEILGQKQREVIFSGKRLQEQLKYSLKRFDELGVLGS